MLGVTALLLLMSDALVWPTSGYVRAVHPAAGVLPSYFKLVYMA